MFDRPAQLIALAVLVFSLGGCIPAGKGDYRIHPDDTQPTEAQTQIPETPTAVPEQAVIKDTPSWSPAAVARNARRVQQSTYVVQAGDTLFKIETLSGAGLEQIVAANNLPPPYTIKQGQRLTILGGLYHRVARGETGIAISRAYNLSWADVVALNGMQYPYSLRVGQGLLLPSNAEMEAITPDDSPEGRAAAFSLNIDDVVTGGEPARVDTASVAGGAPPVSLANPIARPTSFVGGFNWPVAGSLISRFGAGSAGQKNDGINIAAAKGTPVGAAADGVVVYSGNEIGVFGGLVLVDHGDGWITAYGHLGQLSVVRGNRIKKGQAIGSVGDTGYVTQPQLHFEIRKDRKPLDPLTKLSTR
jgi:murein DD-endopeptidase MepM/ murein hydrolase activator NlpD